MRFKVVIIKFYLLSKRCKEFEENETILKGTILQLNQKGELYEAEIRNLKSNLDEMASYKIDYESFANENSRLKLKFKELEKVII